MQKGTRNYTLSFFIALSIFFICYLFFLGRTSDNLSIIVALVWALASALLTIKEQKRVERKDNEVDGTQVAEKQKSQS